MIINSISLKNIRSYTNQKIDFSEGITVLSGDIGSGKSTILLAVEFALFGLLSNESGNSLLRKGANEGSVEINVSINNKNISIHRFLKRKPEGIRQINGTLTINSEKEELTPIELKQKVISLLGYPQESLTKKSLIYHFTTYTPQDEMKQILYEDSDERINIIRKIFGIDKYERIMENSATFSRFLRENKKELLGKISNLDAKRAELKKIEEEKENLLKKEKEISEKLKISKQKTEEIKKKISTVETELRKTQELKKEKAVIETKIKQKEEHIAQLLKEIERTEKEIDLMKNNASADKIEALKAKIKLNLGEEISKLEQEQFDIQKLFAELEVVKKNSEKLKKQVAELDDCPLCLQKVSHEHKTSIISKEDSNLFDINKKMEELSRKFSELRQNIMNKKKEHDESRNAEKELSIIKMHIKNITDREEIKNEKKKILETLKQEITQLHEKSKTIIPNFETQEKEHLFLKNEFEKALAAERNDEIEKIKLSSEIMNSNKIREMLEKEIDEKEKSKQKLNELDKLESWISKKFVSVISQMEKHILSKIYITFNEQFKNLFGILIDDERLNSRIDETFTPKIEQNGYETEFSSLSGGEKTSLSLAYRLALHTAINVMISNIGTKGLLLLDEPTDGFSSEQIDSMKDLFEKVSARQAIIVSHESKIESVADQVVRIVKKGHESLILR